MRNKPMNSIARQSGSTLLIAVVLLLLAGVMTILALNVGIFETRSTANDVRAKSVNEVAEAGLAQGAEYLLRQHPELLAFPTSTTTWTRCTATDTSFPCGAVTDAVYDHDGDAATAATPTAAVPRRGTMYRLTNSGATIANLDAALVSRMLPMANTIATVGTGFQVAYGVAPVMCFAANRVAGEAANGPIRCATSATDASDRRIVTFVSVASIVGESARTTLTQTVGRYPLLATPIGKPPVIASGSIDVTGGVQIVTNPNSGGTGVPVSIWTRKNVDKHGTPNTCYADEFFRYGAKTNSPPTISTGTVKTLLCDTCQCTGSKSLSYDSSGGTQDEGFDVLDVEGDSRTLFTDTATHDGANYNVRSDEYSYPICEFPPDLFANLFGVQAWRDNSTPQDCFNETKIMRDYISPTTGLPINMGADEAFLYKNAATIFPLAANIPTLQPKQKLAGTAFPTNGSALSGLVWCQTACDFSPSSVIGSVDNPVVLVVDGPTDFKGTLYGILFVRSTGSTLDPVTGGAATFRINSNSIIYGAVVVQGSVQKANGTSAIVYNGEILAQIGQNPDNSRYATLPGAWNDRSTY